jgi:DNA-binding GntR family transcriptional regulator
MDRIASSLGVGDGLAYHQRILDSIQAGNVGSAESLMAEHLLRTIQRLISEERKRNG